MKRHIVQTNIKQELYGYTVYVLVTQSCLTLCDYMDCNLPGSSVHGIFQARVLEWIAILFFRGSFWLRDQTWVSCITGEFFTVCLRHQGSPMIRYSPTKWSLRKGYYQRWRVIFLFFFFNFYFYFTLLYNTVLVLPYIDMNPPRVYMHSQTWTPLPPPSP